MTAVAALCAVSADERTPAASPGTVLSVHPFVNHTANPRFDDFHHHVRRRLVYDGLVPGPRVHAWNAAPAPVDPEERPEAVPPLTVYGSFDIDTLTADTVMSFSVINAFGEIRARKRISIAGMAPEDIAEIVALKASDFLNSGEPARLYVSTVPPGCQVFLNGEYAGLSPREFALETGKYDVEVHGIFLEPFTGSLTAEPDRTLDLDIRMNFKGFPTAHWLLAAGTATALTVISRVLEVEYSRRAREGDQWEKNRSRHEVMSNVRLALQHGAVIGWTGAGFCFFVNRSLRQRIFRQ